MLLNMLNAKTVHHKKRVILPQMTIVLRLRNTGLDSQALMEFLRLLRPLGVGGRWWWWWKLVHEFIRNTCDNSLMQTHRTSAVSTRP